MSCFNSTIHTQTHTLCMCSLAYVHLFIYLYWRRWEWIIWHRATTVVPPLSTLTLMWWFRRQVRALGHCRVVHFPLPPLLITTTFRRQWIFLKWVKLPFRFLVTSYFIEGRNIQMWWTELHSLQNWTNFVDCNQLFMSFYELWVMESRLKGHRGCICHGTTSNPVCRASWHKNSTLAVFTNKKKVSHSPPN